MEVDTYIVWLYKIDHELDVAISCIYTALNTNWNVRKISISGSYMFWSMNFGNIRIDYWNDFSVIIWIVLIFFERWRWISWTGLFLIWFEWLRSCAGGHSVLLILATVKVYRRILYLTKYLDYFVIHLYNLLRFTHLTEVHQ